MQLQAQNSTHQRTLFDSTIFANEGDSATKYLVSCDPRSVFENEADFEHTLLNDSAALTVISDGLGVEFEAVARQVRTGSSLAQRADLVAVGTGPTKPLTVIKLMITQMDGEHVTRAFGYACALRAKDIVLIAPSFPTSVRNLISQLGEATQKLGIAIHLIRLSTETSVDFSKGFFRLELLTPPRQRRPRQAFLEDLASRVAELGDESLLGCSISDGRRMDSYMSLGNFSRIRVYSGHGTARIAIIATSRRLHRRLLKKRLPETLRYTLKKYQLEQTSQGGKTIVASFRFPTEAGNGRTSDLVLTRVALAYLEVRKKLLEALGDYSRAATSKARPVQYREPRDGYHLIPRVLLSEDGAASVAAPLPDASGDDVVKGQVLTR